MKGERPAVYWSRGEGGAFYSALAAEEEWDARQRGFRPSASEKDESGLDPETLNEVQMREAEKEKTARRKVGGGSQIP